MLYGLSNHIPCHETNLCTVCFVTSGSCQRGPRPFSPTATVKSTGLHIGWQSHTRKFSPPLPPRRCHAGRGSSKANPVYHILANLGSGPGTATRKPEIGDFLFLPPGLGADHRGKPRLVLVLPKYHNRAWERSRAPFPPRPLKVEPSTQKPNLCCPHYVVMPISRVGARRN